jgi:hypothetical protein
MPAEKTAAWKASLTGEIFPTFEEALLANQVAAVAIIGTHFNHSPTPEAIATILAECKTEGSRLRKAMVELLDIMTETPRETPSNRPLGINATGE